MDLSTVIETLVSSSVRIGSLLVPAGSLESLLGKFSRPLVIWGHHDVYQVRVVGSSITLRHQNRHYLICSKHQLFDCNLQDVGIMLPDGGKLLTSSGSRAFRDEEITRESDAFDLVAFDFVDAVDGFPELANVFFDFEATPPDTQSNNIVAFIVAGYPSKDQKYELEEKNHLGTVRRVLVAEPEGQPGDPGLLKLKFSKKLDFDPDGLSGGPAFVVQLIGGEPKVFLGGMVVRAGFKECYILKAGYIWQFLSGFS